jgi:hypothetical protein
LKTARWRHIIRMLFLAPQSSQDSPYPGRNLLASRWRMVGAGDWEALETGWRWRPGRRWRLAGAAGAGDREALKTISLAPTFLEPLHFSGPYISLATYFSSGLYFSRATTSLWALPLRRLGVLHRILWKAPLKFVSGPLLKSSTKINTRRSLIKWSAYT